MVVVKLLGYVFDFHYRKNVKKYLLLFDKLGQFFSIKETKPMVPFKISFKVVDDYLKDAINNKLRHLRLISRTTQETLHFNEPFLVVFEVL